MPVPGHIEQRIREQAERLARSVRREVYRMVRSGMTMSEILSKLADFPVPPGARKDFEREIVKSMKEMAQAGSWIGSDAGPSALGAADIDVLIAASDIVQPEIRSGIRFHLQEEVRRAIAAGYGPETLRRRLEAYEFGDMRALAFTSLAQFSNNLTFRRAEISGTRRFLYSGPIAPSTRPFCRAHVERIFTLDQIERMDNGQGLPVRQACGGYNCRHEWVAVPDTMSDERAGGRSLRTAEPIRIGKQVYVMDASSRRRLFEHDRVLWVEYARSARNTADVGEWVYTARPLAKAHDGLNEVITGTPADGIWANIHRSRGRSNFDVHLEKRLKDSPVASADDYRIRMAKTINDPKAEVHSFTDHDGTRRIIMHSERTGWDLMLDGFGRIHSSVQHNPKRRYWKKAKLLGVQEVFMGGFK